MTVVDLRFGTRVSLIHYSYEAHPSAKDALSPLLSLNLHLPHARESNVVAQSVTSGILTFVIPVLCPIPILPKCMSLLLNPNCKAVHQVFSNTAACQRITVSTSCDTWPVGPGALPMSKTHQISQS
jgi:hypothetical protein